MQHDDGSCDSGGEGGSDSKTNHLSSARNFCCCYCGLLILYGYLLVFDLKVLNRRLMNEILCTSKLCSEDMMSCSTHSHF